MQDKTPFSAFSDAFCIRPENMIKETYFPVFFLIFLSALRDKQTLKYVI
jgi:hypothetical protein